MTETSSNHVASNFVTRRCGSALLKFFSLPLSYPVVFRVL